MGKIAKFCGLLTAVCIVSTNAVADKKRGSINQLGRQYYIALNDQKAKSGQNLFSGQKIQVSLVHTGDGALEGVGWNLDGECVEEFDPTPIRGSVSRLVTEYGQSRDHDRCYNNTLDRKHLTFFWVDGSSDGKPENVRAYKIVNASGGEKVKTVYFKLKRPSSTFFVNINLSRKFYYPDITNSTSINRFAAIGLTRAGHINDPYGYHPLNGIFYKAQVNVPWSNGTQTSGRVSMLQNIIFDRKAKIVSGNQELEFKHPQNGIACADSYLPTEIFYRLIHADTRLIPDYNGPSSSNATDYYARDENGDKHITIDTSDSPSQGIYVTVKYNDGSRETLPAENVRINNETFYTYLMYKPPVATGRWIPLRMIPWNWGGKMSNLHYVSDTHTIEADVSDLFPTIAQPRKYAIGEQMTYPEWRDHGDAGHDWIQ